MNVEGISVAIGADLTNLDKGLGAAVSKVQGFEADVTKAAAAAGNSFNGLASSVTAAAGRYTDAAGRLREANGRFVSSATLAAEAAGNFGGVMAKAATGFDQFTAASEKIKGTGEALTVGVTLPILAAGAASLKAAGDIEALQNGLKAVVEQTLKTQNPLVTQQEILAETAKQFSELNEVAKLPGLGLTEVVRGSINLETIGFSAEKAQKSIKSFGNAIATVGKGREEFGRAINGLQQLANTEFPLGEDLNIIKDAIPQVTPLLKEAFGTARTEDLQQLGITSEQVVNTIIDGLSKLPPVVGGINNSFENASDAVVKSAGAIGGSLNKTFGIENLVNRFSDAITGAAEAFTSLSPATQKTVFALVGLAAGVGPLLAGLGALGAAIPAIVGGLGTIGAAVGLAAGPVALIAVAIAGAAVAIVSNWDDIVSYFTTGSGGQVFGDLAKSVTASVGVIVKAFQDLGGSDSNFGDLLNASELVKFAVEEIAKEITAFSDTVNHIVSFVSDLLHLEFRKAFEDAGGYVESFTRPLRGLVGLLEEVRKTPGNEGYSDYFSRITTNALGSLVVIQAVKKEIEAPLPAAGLLVALEQKLKALKDAKPNLTTERDIAAANKQIEALEKQIKRLNELGVATSEAAKALQGLRDALKTTDREVAAGINFDPLGDKIATLGQKIPDLLAAGFAPRGKVVQGFVAQLAELEAEYDKLKARIAEKQAKDALIGADTIKPPKPPGLPETLQRPAFDNSELEETAARQQQLYLSMSDGQKQALQAFNDFNKNSEALAQAFPIDAFSAIGAGIGNALGTGANAFQGAADALLSVLADFGAKYGQQLLLLGAADIATGIFTTKGIAEIAAGTALIAGSAALGAIAGNRGGASGSALAGPSAPMSTYRPPAPGSAAQGSTIQNNTQIIQVSVSGGALLAAVRVETDRQGRVVSARQG